MGSAKQERKRIYRETMEAVLAKYRYTKGQFCRDMDHTAAWFGTTFTKGYYDIKKPNLKLWAITIGCTEDELTAIPASPQSKKEVAEKPPADSDIAAMVAGLTETMLEGFRMLHTDIRNLIETMDRYWKPTEPKYQIQEREQP